MQNICLVRDFRGWMQNMVQQKKMKRAAEVVVRRWAKCDMGPSFATWRVGYLAAKKNELTRNRIVSRLVNLSLSSALRTWCDAVRMSRIAARVVVRWSGKCVQSAFDTWANHMQEINDSRQIVARVVGKMRYLCASAAFDGWTNGVAERREVLQRCQKVVGRLANGELARALVCWRQLCIIQEDKRGCITRWLSFAEEVADEIARRHLHCWATTVSNQKESRFKTNRILRCRSKPGQIILKKASAWNWLPRAWLLVGDAGPYLSPSDAGMKMLPINVAWKRQRRGWSLGGKFWEWLSHSRPGQAMLQILRGLLLRAPKSSSVGRLWRYRAPGRLG